MNLSSRKKLDAVPGLIDVENTAKREKIDNSTNKRTKINNFPISSRYEPIPAITSKNYGKQTIYPSAVQYLNKNNYLSQIQALEENNQLINEEEDRRLEGLQSLMLMVDESNQLISDLFIRVKRAEEKLKIENRNTKGMHANMEIIQQSLKNAHRDGDDLQDIVVSKVGKLNSKLQNVEDKLNEKERCFEKQLDDICKLNDKFKIQNSDLNQIKQELLITKKKNENDILQLVDLTRLKSEASFKSQQDLDNLRHFVESKHIEGQQAVSTLSQNFSNLSSTIGNNSQQVNIKLNALECLHRSLAQYVSSQLESVNQKNKDTQKTLKEEIKENENILENMSEEFKMNLTKQESLLSEANSKLNHVENDLKTHEIKSNQVIRAMNIQIEKRLDLIKNTIRDVLQSVQEKIKNEAFKQSTLVKNIEERVDTIGSRLTNERKSVEKVLLAEIKKREELSEETTENFLSLNEDLKKDISKIDNQLEIAFFQLKNNKKDVSKEIQSSIEKVDDKIATNREENDRKYSLLTSTIFKLEDSIGSKFSQLESNLRNELCENLKTFTDWEKVMSTNVTDIRKTISDVQLKIKENEEHLNHLKNELKIKSEVQSNARMRTELELRNEIERICEKIDILELRLRRESTKRESYTPEPEDYKRSYIDYQDSNSSKTNQSKDTYQSQRYESEEENSQPYERTRTYNGKTSKRSNSSIVTKKSESQTLTQSESQSEPEPTYKLSRRFTRSANRVTRPFSKAINAILNKKAKPKRKSHKNHHKHHHKHHHKRHSKDSDSS